MSAHTPTPWVLDQYATENVYSNDLTGAIVAKCGPFEYVGRSKAESEANAAFIFRACNAHDELFSLAERFASECGECNGSGVEAESGHPCGECSDIRDVIARVGAP